MPEWFLGGRDGATGLLRGQMLLRTDVADTVGAVVVETRRLAASEEDRTGDLGQCRRWETTICPRDALDPDGPETAVFAVCDRLAEAYVAHEQAVDFCAAALGSTARSGHHA